MWSCVLHLSCFIVWVCGSSCFCFLCTPEWQLIVQYVYIILFIFVQMYIWGQPRAPNMMKAFRLDVLWLLARQTPWGLLGWFLDVTSSAYRTSYILFLINKRSFQRQIENLSWCIFWVFGVMLFIHVYQEHLFCERTKGLQKWLKLNESAFLIRATNVTRQNHDLHDYTQTNTHAHRHTHTDTHTHTHTHIRTHTHTHNVCVCLSTCLSVSVCACALLTSTSSNQAHLFDFLVPRFL